MDPSLRERFEQLGPVRTVDRAASGLPAIFVLRLPVPAENLRTIDGMTALARRALTMLKAKRAIESLFADGSVVVNLRAIEDHAVLKADLAKAGIIAAVVARPAALDVRGLRERLGLTRGQFALRYSM